LTYCRIGSDAATVTSTTTTITTSGLQFNLVSGSTYEFRFGVLYQAYNVIVGLRLGLMFPAVTTVGANVDIPVTATAGTTFYHSGFISATGGSVTATSSPTVKTNVMAFITGTITPSANGTLHVFNASEAACASGILIKAGSYGILNKIS
jgi:hypothetical protein